MPDFELAASEFVRQASILEDLVRTVDVSAAQDGVTPIIVGTLTLPVLPTGGQNTMAAAAIVLLAAHFEEFVRQQIEEYARAMFVDFAYLSPEMVEKVADHYWKAGSSRLNRIRPRGSPGWAGRAEPILRSLIDYPVGSTVSSFQPGMLSEHDNNMRWDTICEISGRVGVKKLESLIFKDAPFKALMGSPRADRRSAEVKTKLNEFYELRNGIVHSISQHAGIGASTVFRWIAFFKIFAPAFVIALDDAFSKFSAEIAVTKSGAV